MFGARGLLGIGSTLFHSVGAASVDIEKCGGYFILADPDPNRPSVAVSPLM